MTKNSTKQKSEPQVKRQKTFDLSLTRFELLHLRDLMSILLPPDGNQTLSAALAASEKRSMIESMLWEKLSSLCVEADLPVGDEAPDYVIAAISSPALGVFQINQDLDEASGESVEAGFLPSEDEAEVSDEE